MKEVLDSNSNFNTPKNKLPNAGGILALGILSIVLAGFIGLILGIIGLSMSSNPRSSYIMEPDKYDESSYRVMNAGRICSIVGICLSVAYTLFKIIFAASLRY